MMIKFAEVSHGIVRAIGSAPFLPESINQLAFVNITEYEGEVKAGYKYDGENNIFIEIKKPLEPEPVEPDIQPTETIDEKLARMERQLQEQQQQNLILVDINLTVYEELLNMKEQFVQLSGAKDNA